MQTINEVVTRLQHIDPVVWTIIGGYLAPYGQELLKQVRDFGEKTNYLIGLVAIPAVVAILTGLAQPQVLAGLNPVVQLGVSAAVAAVISQLKFGLSLNPRLKQKAELESLRQAVSPQPEATEATPAALSPAADY